MRNIPEMCTSSPPSCPGQRKGTQTSSRSSLSACARTPPCFCMMGLLGLLTRLPRVGTLPLFSLLELVPFKPELVSLSSGVALACVGDCSGLLIRRVRCTCAAASVCFVPYHSMAGCGNGLIAGAVRNNGVEQLLDHA